MALTYKKVMSTDYSKLTATAKAWDDMAAEFKKAESNYAATLRGLSGWQGEGFGIWRVNYAATQYEYAAAQTQAKAIAKLLGDAHQQFTELKKRLESTVQDAIKDNMAVDDEGNVRFDTSKLEQGSRTAYAHDPSYQESARKAAASWAKRITDLVRAVDDADAGVKLSLERAVRDEQGGKNDETYGTGFNGKAQGDVEVYEARNSADIGTKLASGEKVSAAELAEFNRALRDNAKDPEFSKTFLNQVGSEGTIKLGSRLDRLAHFEDKDNKKSYESIKGGLANSIGTATKDKSFQNQWREDMRKFGVAEYEGPAGSGTPAKGSEGKVRGYQILMGIMEHGDAKSYDGGFVRGLTEDVYAAEKESKGNIWDISQQYNEKNASWFVNDPLDSSLGLLGKHPDESTRFLYPGETEDEIKKSALHYLLKERDWNGIVPEHSEWGTNHETSRVAYGSPLEDSDARVGFGAALEAASTGRVAGSQVVAGPHSEAQATILHETVKILDQDGKGDEIKENLKVPLGRTLNSYAEDVFDILSGESPNPSGDTIKADGSDSHIASDQHSLIRVMRGISDGVAGTTPDGDPIRVFDVLYEAQQGQAAEHLTGARSVPADKANDVVADWNIRARNVGEAMGAMTGIGSDMVLDNRDNKVGKINDDARYAYHVGGGILNFIPGVGDAAQRTVDAITYEWSKDVTTEADLVARKEDSKNSTQGKEGTRAILDSWAMQQGIDKTDGFKNSRDESEGSYKDGREEAFTALRTRK